jgi:hypothetical protein
MSLRPCPVYTGGRGALVWQGARDFGREREERHHHIAVVPNHAVFMLVGQVHRVLLSQPFYLYLDYNTSLQIVGRENELATLIMTAGDSHWGQANSFWVESCQ